MDALTERLIHGPARQWTGPPRRCSTCRHRRVPISDRLFLMGARYALCDRSINAPEVGANFCSGERVSYSTIDTCGFEGRYWEPKPRAWWRRIFDRLTP